MDFLFQWSAFQWSVNLILIILLAWFIHRLKTAELRRKIDQLPGPKANFLFGNALSFIGKREDRYKKGFNMMLPYQKYPMARLWFGPFPRISVRDVNALEAILSSTKTINKATFYTYLQAWLGLGLLTSTGDRWRTRRKLITPSFHFNILNQFVVIMNEQAEILTSILNQFEGKEAFDIYPYLARCTLDVICETAMGKQIGAQRGANSEYVDAVNKLGEMLLLRDLHPWLAPDLVFKLSPAGRLQAKCLKTLHGFTNRVIQERKLEFKERKEHQPDSKSETADDTSQVYGHKRRRVFLDLLLESSMDGKSLTDEDVREEVDTFMFEGHDTTASGINWILYNIGRYPEIQSKLVQELDHVFGSSMRPATPNDLSQLKYLECIIKESMRLFPPVPFFGRMLTEDLTTCGYTIPAGVDVMFPVRDIHLCPENFPDPEKFDPDRFLSENSANRHPYAYIPFSAGPRNCIGQKFAMMEEKVVVSQVVRRFKVKSMQSPDEIKLLAEFVFRPANGTWIKLERRSE